jgi:hypothetical protein
MNQMIRGRLLLTVLFSFLLLFTQAKKVEQADALDFAAAFINLNLAKEFAGIKNVQTIQSGSNILYYQINLEPSGWILISADDKAEPVLGYSTTGEFVSNETMPAHVKAILEGLEKNLESIIFDQELQPSAKWDELIAVPTLKSTNASVAPLIKMMWNQGKGFNQFCPEDPAGPDGHAYVGCVAVAMAQALSVHKNPVRPVGVYSYNHSTYGTLFVNFDNEPAYAWNDMTVKSGDPETARLLYHCGVAVNMDYGADGSGAYTKDVAKALKRNFGFTSQTQYFNRFDDEEAWVAFMKEELNTDFPIIYAGNAPSGGVGHCYNVDGYDSNDLFHINWGWGGTNNGYYNINLFKDGDNDYTSNQEVVIGVGPAYMGPTSISLSSLEVYADEPEGTFVAKVFVEDLTTDDSFTYELTGAARFPEGFLPSAFEIRNDSLFTLKVFDAGSTSKVTLIITVTDSENYSLENTFEIAVLPKTSISNFQNTSFSIYPNPTHTYVYIETEAGADEYVKLYNTCGVLLNRKKLEKGITAIDVSELPAGIYFVKLYSGQGSVLGTRKIVHIN